MSDERIAIVKNRKKCNRENCEDRQCLDAFEYRVAHVPADVVMALRGYTAGDESMRETLLTHFGGKKVITDSVTARQRALLLCREQRCTHPHDPERLDLSTVHFPQAEQPHAAVPQKRRSRLRGLLRAS
jgi:hypothetical protein